MRIQRASYGITAGIFSTKKLAKKNKTYEYHKHIEIISEEYVKMEGKEYGKRNIKYIDKNSKGGTKQ